MRTDSLLNVQLYYTTRWRRARKTQVQWPKDHREHQQPRHHLYLMTGPEIRTAQVSVTHRPPSLTHSRSIIGLHPDALIDEEHDHGPASELLWSKIRAVLREPFAEFWGVVVMVMFGHGSVAQVLLSTGQATAPGGSGYGSCQSINWGYVHNTLCMSTH